MERNSRNESLVLLLRNYTYSWSQRMVWPWSHPNECSSLSLNSPFLPDVFFPCWLSTCQMSALFSPLHVPLDPMHSSSRQSHHPCSSASLFFTKTFFSSLDLFFFHHRDTFAVSAVQAWCLFCFHPVLVLIWIPQ